MNKWRLKTNKTKKLTSNIGFKEIKMQKSKNSLHTLANQANNRT